MTRKIMRVISFILFFIGILLFVYPHGKDIVKKKHQSDVIQEFVAETSKDNSSDHAYKHDPVYQSMVSYNEKIYDENQMGMTDAWANIDDSISMNSNSLHDRMLGYISISAMDVIIPLYAGADAESLYYGAAVLAETSMPIGGDSTNCVIAAHRGGYEGTAMFRDIEKIKPGDIVEVTNRWETLRYEAVKMIVISPDDLQAIKIIPGEDLLTLITCHPYGDNKQRYVVYCRRINEDAISENIDEMIPYDGEPYSPSSDVIAVESFIDKSAEILIFIIVVYWTVNLLRK